jgi:hypothetical protein
MLASSSSGSGGAGRPGGKGLDSSFLRNLLFAGGPSGSKRNAANKKVF